MRRAALLGALAACGRVDFAPRLDASVDAAACTFGPWATPTPATALDSAGTDWGPALSADGLEIIFSTDRSGAFEIWHAVRASPADDFPAPEKFPTTATDSYDPTLSANRLVAAWTDTARGIVAVTRADTASAWSDPPAVQVGDGADYTFAKAPDFSPDMQHLYLTAIASADGKDHMWEAASPSPPARIAGLPDDAMFGSVRGDDREIVYQSQLGPSGTLDLYTATRAAFGEPFANPVAVDAANTPDGDEGDADLSDDGRTLWFAAHRPTTAQWDLYVTTRACL